MKRLKYCKNGHGVILDNDKDIQSLKFGFMDDGILTGLGYSYGEGEFRIGNFHSDALQGPGLSGNKDEVTFSLFEEGKPTIFSARLEKSGAFQIHLLDTDLLLSFDSFTNAFALKKGDFLIQQFYMPMQINLAYEDMLPPGNLKCAVHDDFETKCGADGCRLRYYQKYGMDRFVLERQKEGYFNLVKSGSAFYIGRCFGYMTQEGLGLEKREDGAYIFTNVEYASSRTAIEFWNNRIRVYNRTYHNGGTKGNDCFYESNERIVFDLGDLALSYYCAGGKRHFFFEPPKEEKKAEKKDDPAPRNDEEEENEAPKKPSSDSSLAKRFEELMSKNKPDPTPEQQLEAMVGLANVKKVIKRIKAYLGKNKGQRMNLNMAFTGNPGTGKTTVARILGRLLHQEGILPDDTFVEAQRGDLVGEFIGSTAKRTQSVIEAAMGGVLFIDEAYSLNGGGDRDFGKEAIATLIKAMEDHPGELLVILAGYEKETMAMIELNPGFKSRVQFYIPFDDYSLDELRQIASMKLESNGYSASEEVLAEIAKLVYQKRKEPGYANGRTVSNVLNQIQFIQAERTVEEAGNKEITMVDVMAFIAENPQYQDRKKKAMPRFDRNDIDLSQRSIKPTPYFHHEEDFAEKIISVNNHHEDGSYSESSGFIISENGYAITCAHCVEEHAKLEGKRVIRDRHDRKVEVKYEMELVRANPMTDVALLKIKSREAFPYLKLNEDQNRSPQALTKIVMLGYPFGESSFQNMSVTLGRIASVQEDEKGVIRYNLDISAQSGNSGSCIIDSDSGKVIGILFGKATNIDKTHAEEIPLAVSSDEIYRLLEQ